MLRGHYDRPALELFNLHSDHVIERFGLAELQLRDEAKRIEPRSDGVHVATRGGASLEAQRVVLAIGAGGHPEWPKWAPRSEPRVRHIFDDVASPTGADLDGESSLLVVGGGISAAQFALRHAVAGRKVDLVTRHPLRVHDFDSDPGWLGPKLMPIFRRERSPEGRRRLIRQARHRGSVTPEVRRALRSASASGQLEIHEATVSDLQVASGGLRLALASGRVLEGDHRSIGRPVSPAAARAAE